MKKFIGHLLAILTVSIWSSTFIVSKILLEELTPLQILLFRFVITVIFLTILYPRFIMPESVKEELLFLLTGGCLALYFFFENSALIHTYSSNVSLIVATIPLITALLSAVLYKTHNFNKKSIIGLIVAYLGVFMIVLNGQKLAGIEPIGDFFALMAAIMFAVYTLTMQRIQKSYHLIDMTRKVMFYGLVVLAVIILITRQTLWFDLMDKKLLISLLFLGIVASSLAFLMWNKAIQIVGSIATNQYIYLVPVITTILSAIIFKEKITLITLFGAALILFGLYFSENAQKNLKDLSDDVQELKSV